MPTPEIKKLGRIWGYDTYGPLEGGAENMEEMVNCLDFPGRESFSKNDWSGVVRSGVRVQFNICLRLYAILWGTIQALPCFTITYHTIYKEMRWVSRKSSTHSPVHFRSCNSMLERGDLHPGISATVSPSIVFHREVVVDQLRAYDFGF